MNENTFTRNFRTAFSPQAPRVLNAGERANPTFQGTKGQMPENYGSQQNAIGLTALSLLLGRLGYAPAAIASLLATGEQAEKAYPQVRAKRLDGAYNSEETVDNGIIDKTPTLSPLFQGLTPIPVNGGYEDTLKAIEDNEKAIQKIRDSLNISDRTKGRR